MKKLLHCSSTCPDLGPEALRRAEAGLGGLGTGPVGV